MATVKIDWGGDLYYPECPYAGKEVLTVSRKQSCGNTCLHPKVKKSFCCRDDCERDLMLCSVVCKTSDGCNSDCPLDKANKPSQPPGSPSGAEPLDSTHQKEE